MAAIAVCCGCASFAAKCKACIPRLLHLIFFKTIDFHLQTDQAMVMCMATATILLAHCETLV
jgi:hypothetical protein